MCFFFILDCQSKVLVKGNRMVLFKLNLVLLHGESFIVKVAVFRNREIHHFAVIDYILSFIRAVKIIYRVSKQNKLHR